MAAYYLNLSSKDWQVRIKKAFERLTACNICPRNCRVNRLKNQKGFCRLGRYAVISNSHPHFGEERCLVGERGSGIIFFSHCNLACQYCQNYDISQLDFGQEVTEEKLAQIMIGLQKIGCHNINLVTTTPNIAQILKALPLAIKQGLNIPLVYNSSGYDGVNALKLLDGIIDIYLPDFKYADAKIAKQYSLVTDYPKIAQEAIKEMHRQVGDLVIDKNGIAQKGLLIRHLVLPNNLAGTDKILDFIAQKISKNTFVNIMDQYHPAYKAFYLKKINRSITKKEFQKALDWAREKGLSRIYY